MHLTTAEIALTVTAVTLTMGMLALFFVLIAVRQFRVNADRQARMLIAVLEAQENERRRIAEDMHDGLGQLLAASKLQADTLRHTPPDRLVHGIAVVKETLDQASAEVRAVIQDLMPRKLERDGLLCAVEDLARSVNSSGLSTCVRSDGSVERYNPRVELNLYRIVQELLANAVRHATATEIAVSLTFGPDALRILVEDDGTGISPTADADSNGNGLRNIQSRAAWLKGTFALGSNAPRGSRFELVFHPKHLRE
ncbi:MAG TPA: sensor histidine kinase [Chitinophagales bacterium]|nr:sensor histidine kinase [Chitinophagales bacterium]